MRFTSAVSTADTIEGLERELLAQVGTEDGAPDLLICFFTAPVIPAARVLGERLRAALRPTTFLGVSCEGVIGGEIEVERAPGAAALACWLPEAQLRPFHLRAGEWNTLLADEAELARRIGTGAEHRGHLLLADPFTTPIEPLMERLDEALGAPTFGGMASGAQTPGGNLLLLDDQFFHEGVVGVGIGGNLEIATVVSQGCRPIGAASVITRVENGLIAELGRRPALEVAQETLQALTEDEQKLLQHGLFVGVVINEYQDRFQRGDFLVRGLMGVNRDTGGLAIGDFVRAGQTVQFHLRDEQTAHEDLSELLKGEAGSRSAAGALLFSCNGRGTRMFSQPHHDVRTTRTVLPGLPVAGFFAMGELGAVGGKSFIHGHTASLALFRPT